MTQSQKIVPVCNDCGVDLEIEEKYTGVCDHCYALRDWLKDLIGAKDIPHIELLNEGHVYAIVRSYKKNFPHVAQFPKFVGLYARTLASTYVPNLTNRIGDCDFCDAKTISVSELPDNDCPDVACTPCYFEMTLDESVIQETL